MNNSYGIKAYDAEIYKNVKFALQAKGGCLYLMQQCKLSQLEYHCQRANDVCRNTLEFPFAFNGNRSVYDIRRFFVENDPPDYYERFLNLPNIQQDLGVPLNFTVENDAVYNSFQLTGDAMRGDYLQTIGDVLNKGIRVSLVYGDADYICNWFGGEAISLAIKFADSANFRAEKYQPLLIDGKPKSFGQVREHGNFSFVRMYEAGHEVPYYQPKASLEVFRRLSNGLSIQDGSQ